ncbi:VOC domain-containing protein [Planctomycetales bacterium 10988]|nr:VOC domain-containing protein [Planctomycetales bacterium 10988]
MIQSTRFCLRKFACYGLVGMLMLSLVSFAPAQEKPKRGNQRMAQQTLPHFQSAIVHFGIVVHDIEVSREFYTKALGFEEASTFEVAPEQATKIGLTHQLPLKVYVMKAGKGENATQVKLMEIYGAPNQRVDHTTIAHSLGVSYLTVMVKNLPRAIAMAKKYGAAPLAEGPVKIAGDAEPPLYIVLVRDPDGNLIELIGPMPAKKPRDTAKKKPAKPKKEAEAPADSKVSSEE